MGGFGTSPDPILTPPLIDLGPPGTDARGVGPWDRVLALMAFPDDRNAQLAHLAALHARSLDGLERLSEQARTTRTPVSTTQLLAWFAQLAKAGFEHDGGFGAMSRGVRSGDDARHVWTQRAIQGQLAAEILCLLLARPEPPRGQRAPISARQAFHIVGKLLSEIDAPEIPKSRASIKPAWVRFRGVAHLWLALRLEPHTDRKPRTLDAFLARAEALRLLARKDPSLDQVATWVVPTELLGRLPAVEEPALPPFSDMDMKAIHRHWRSYRRREKKGG